MNFSESFQSATRALQANKIRTFLTMLGIIIGVFSVVLLVSLVRGVQNYVSDQFNSIGSNLIFVMPGRAGINQDPAASFTDNKLKIENVNKLKSEGSDFIAEISPIINTGKTLGYKNKKYFSSVAGTYSNYKEIFNIQLSNGEFFTVSDDAASKKVVVLGSQVAKNLFSSKNPVGNKIKIDTKIFEVVGVMQPKGQDFDEQVIIPYNTAKDSLNIDNITYITLKLINDSDVDSIMRKVETIMLTDLKKDEFTVLNQKDLLDSIQSILGILAAGLSAVAAISLIVGGIGIMNIMLVAVGERIREIGLRKALGATSFEIAFQFMTEAVILSVLGGIIGLSLGYAAAMFARRFVRTEVPMWAILLSLGFSLLIGVAFGTYPAFKASKKDPIEALRYE